MTNFLTRALIVSAFFIGYSSAFAQTSAEVDEGVALFRSGDFVRSVELLEKVVAAEQGNKLGWFYLGASYVKLGKTREAEKAFRKAGFGDWQNREDLERPLKIVRKPRATYTDDARSNNISGEVRLVIEFQADGKIGFVFPYQRLMFGLTENAVAAARGIVFEPALKDGKPVTVVAMLSYGFSIY